jgi:hypothetical protein
LGLEELEDGKRFEGEEACRRVLVRWVFVVVVVGGVETDRAYEGGRLLAAEDFVQEGGCCGRHFSSLAKEMSVVVFFFRGERRAKLSVGCLM